MAYLSGSSSTHFGGGLSIVDITATLYGSILNLNPKKPEDEVRDRFILSKSQENFTTITFNTRVFNYTLFLFCIKGLTKPRK